MALYQVKNQWGGSSAPLNEGGKWILGSRHDQNPVAIDIQSNDGGETLTGTMNYAGEGSIAVKCTRLSANHYQVENQWGGDSAPFHPAGQWIIGFRSNQRVIALNIKSSNNGNTFSGTMRYEGEGGIGFFASSATGDIYAVKNQWGGSDAAWHEGGFWAIGSRQEQDVIALDITSSDNGKTLAGTMQYNGEGEIGFRGVRIGDNNYQVENQWGGSGAPWNPAGTWVIGFRDNQAVIALKVSASDDNNALQGTVTYDGEGPISFDSAVVIESAAEVA